MIELFALNLCLIGIPAAFATTLGLAIFKRPAHSTAALSSMAGLLSWVSFLACLGQPDLFQAASVMRELAWPILQVVTGTAFAACLGTQIKGSSRFGAGVASLLGGTLLGCHLMYQALQNILSF